MNAEQIYDRINRLKTDIEQELLDRMPRKVGIVAVNHFKENFRQSGFVDNGLKPWKRPLRHFDGTGAAAERKTLTSGRNHLMRSIQYTSRPGEVTVLNPVEYAAIHNEGGTINTHPRITPKLRKFAWAKVYSLAGMKRGKKTPLPKQLPEKARMWKAIALTKKARLNVRVKMPKRQFIGDSAELNKKVTQIINRSLTDIAQKITNGTRNL